MSPVVLRGATWVLRLALVGAVAFLALTAAATRLAPVVGREVFVIRGASMVPAIPLGSAIVATRTSPGEIVAGDIVTFRGTNGVVVTHRVIEVIVHEGEHLYRTQGDANPTADAFLVPEGAVIGVVETTLPLAGYVMAMMAQPSGILSLATALVACYLALSIAEAPAARGQRAGDARWIQRGTPA